MRNFKVGDKIEMFDGSYAFGIKDGMYDVLSYCQSKGPFTIIRVNLSTLGFTVRPNKSGRFDRTADILITDNNGGFWFVPSRFARLISPMHTITIAGKDIEISDESYRNLKKQLLAD